MKNSFSSKNIFLWGEKSLKELEGAAPILRRVLNRALSYGIIDFSVVETIRGEYEQNVLYDMGLSKLKYPDSKHNVVSPQKYSLACDLYPHIKGQGASLEPMHFAVLIGVIMAAAAEEGVEVRSGGDWNSNGIFFTDQNFDDLCHFEIVTKG